MFEFVLREEDQTVYLTDRSPPGGRDCGVSPGGAGRAAAFGAVEEEGGACKHRNMAAERGAGDGHIDDNMGNELQLLAAGNTRTRTVRAAHRLLAC